MGGALFPSSLYWDVLRSNAPLPLRNWGVQGTPRGVAGAWPGRGRGVASSHAKLLAGSSARTLARVTSELIATVRAQVPQQSNGCLTTEGGNDALLFFRVRAAHDEPEKLGFTI